MYNMKMGHVQYEDQIVDKFLVVYSNHWKSYFDFWDTPLLVDLEYRSLLCINEALDNSLIASVLLPKLTLLEC